MHRKQNCSGAGMDRGPKPLVLNIDQEAMCNSNFRAAVWTGKQLQVTLMSIPPGGEIGVEMHACTDQFLRIEQGTAVVRLGKCQAEVRDFQRVGCHDAIVIPAGTWHNVVNCGNVPLKLYSIYAPPHHPFGTLHKTKEDAEKHH